MGPVEISKYLGTWFEQARLPQQFQKGLCSKAVYTATEGKAEVITVNNGGDDPAYPDEKISGTATLTHHDALTSKFDLKFNFFAQGQYWILDLDAEYKYALVGGPRRDNLYVLSRERHAPMATVQAMIQKAVTVHGYTNTDKMVYRKTTCYAIFCPRIRNRVLLLCEYRRIQDTVASLGSEPSKIE